MANWHRLRKSIHLFCVLLFMALPFLNVVRFDLPRQRFYFAGYELWISEFGIVFFSLMFLMFVVVAMSVFYGRVYCGYLCPQMIFSETSTAVEMFIRRKVVKHFIAWEPKAREWLTRTLWYAVTTAGSVLLAFVFVSYFVAPRDLLGSLLALDVRTAAGISGAAVTAIAFFDFTLVRLRFCTTVCPYGYLQGMLGDSNTLLVRYRDERRDCIECKKCVRVCPMGIDIRKSPFQIECVHCAECIEACDEILGRRGKAGLIHYAWGDQGEPIGQSRNQPWHRRIGVRDGKRVIVLLVLLFYAAGLFAALSMRHAVLVQVSPERGDSLYRVSNGRVYNTFRYSIANRSRTPAAVVFAIQDLPDATLSPVAPVPVQPGDSVRGQFEIWQPAGRRDLVAHFTIVARTAGRGAVSAFPMTFLSPPEAK